MEGELKVLNHLEQVLPLTASVIVKPAIYKTIKTNYNYRVWIKGKTSIQALAKIIYNDDCDLCIAYKKQRMTQWNEV